MKDSQIIRTYGKGFLEVKHGVKVLHVKGDAYDRGYQHGRLLAEEISFLIPEVLESAALVIAKTIDCSFKTAQEKMIIGKNSAEKYIPIEFLEEMRGITDGISSRGYPLSFEDVFLWNTMYDQWCLYAHPKYSSPNNLSDKNRIPSDIKTGSFLIKGAGCSSFSAWGDAVDGEDLIFGKNMDNLNLPGLLENRIMVVAKPSRGYGHAFITHPGMIGIDGGINEAGLCMMTQYNASTHETMHGCGIGIFTRLILSYAKKIKEAEDILKSFPRCTGIAYHVACDEQKYAAIIEASASQVCLRFPAPSQNILWTSNHSNCYPGWLHYTGYNYVQDQAPVYGMSDVSSIDKWQNSLRDYKNINLPAPSRFERYRELLNEFYGKLNPDIAIQILSDRYDPFTRNTRPKNKPSTSNNRLATICALYPDYTFTKEDSSKTFKAHISNLWSAVLMPSSGDIRLAIKDFPAQYGGYEHFNLHYELGRSCGIRELNAAKN